MSTLPPWNFQWSSSVRYGYFLEGRTGLFSWCVISRFYFPWNVNLRKYSSWSATWRFRVTRELLELITNIRDFTTLFYVILRRKTSPRFIKTENIKCDVCIMIVTSHKASVTTKRTPVWQFRLKTYTQLVISRTSFHPFAVRAESGKYRIQKNPCTLVPTDFQLRRKMKFKFNFRFSFFFVQ